MDDLQKEIILIDLEDRYISMHSHGKELDDYEKMMLSKSLFPKWWRSNQNVDYKIKLLKESLENQEKLNKLEEVMNIDKVYSKIKFGFDFEESKKKHHL